MKKGGSTSKSKAHNIFEDSEEGAAPEDFAYQRVMDRPKARSKKPGTFNPCSLTGRETTEGASLTKGDDLDSGLWEA